jgi:CheY-like chemotaxis protein
MPIAEALRVLVVDDNAVNRELIRALLTPFDLVIETAADGVEAIEAQARTPFDVILMDVQMPVMDGLTATRRIRAAAAPDRSSVPIIAMTANVLAEQVERCLEAGMTDHIGKPIDPATLVEKLAKWSGGAPDCQPSPQIAATGR